MPVAAAERVSMWMAEGLVVGSTADLRCHGRWSGAPAVLKSAKATQNSGRSGLLVREPLRGMSYCLALHLAAFQLRSLSSSMAVGM